MKLHGCKGLEPAPQRSIGPLLPPTQRLVHRKSLTRRRTFCMAKDKVTEAVPPATAAQEEVKSDSKTSNGTDPESVWQEENIPVAVRRDGLGKQPLILVPPMPQSPISSHPNPGSPSSVEYLKIKDIRDQLSPRDSPFVHDNNAGGGFGTSVAAALLPPVCHR